MVGRDIDPNFIQRELDYLAQMASHAALSAVPINIPQLLGLVELPNGKAVGILEELIPQSQELSTICRTMNIGTISKQRREAWSRQIRQIVSWLHTIGVTWGGEKAGNVPIHPDTVEAWLIDFGGGYTDGWVDDNLAGTIEGDDPAVQKIFQFLQV